MAPISSPRISCDAVGRKAADEKEEEKEEEAEWEAEERSTKLEAESKEREGGVSDCEHVDREDERGESVNSMLETERREGRGREGSRREGEKEEEEEEEKEEEEGWQAVRERRRSGCDSREETMADSASCRILPSLRSVSFLMAMNRWMEYSLTSTCTPLSRLFVLSIRFLLSRPSREHEPPSCIVLFLGLPRVVLPTSSIHSLLSPLSLSHFCTGGTLSPS
jgi:hypothetical protein